MSEKMSHIIWMACLPISICQKYVNTSDRPKFGSVPVPAEILTWTGISVSVPARFVISVPAEFSVEMWTERNRN